jgi:hypothetical protein
MKRDYHDTHVDVVELVAENPLLLGIINYEFHIRWESARLDGRQISTNDLTLGMLVGEFYRPNSSSRPNV